MKTYTYAVFLRNPETAEVQHGTVSFDVSEGYLSFADLVTKLQSETIKENVYCGYTLIGFNVVSVEDTE